MKAEQTSSSLGPGQDAKGADDLQNQRVPDKKEAREATLAAARNYVSEHRLIPPLSLEELQAHTARAMADKDIPASCRALTMVLLNNALWEGVVASVPYERRVLLIPQCLRSPSKCRAAVDEFGLLCEECGACLIGELQSLAEGLGYVVLVAEGTTLVTKLLESGKVDAVVGVSCLAVLERTFPHMSAEAIPGIAVPLLQDGCNETLVDQEWIRNAIELKSDEKWMGHVDISGLRDEVSEWFKIDRLRRTLAAGVSSTEEVALAWLAKTGKRWRPFLAAAVFKALRGVDHDMPEAIEKLAIAVECFHKASLIHDDIEDDDAMRYGEATLHKEHGTPIALNAGDLLLGEGYRMIAACGADSESMGRMLATAAGGHKTLCLGQGEELFWAGSSFPPSSATVLEVFRCKTSPAFGVAICLGAICAGADSGTCAALKQFSESLGIAYQIRDDIDDFIETETAADFARIKPSLALALALEAAPSSQREIIAAGWQYEDKEQEAMAAVAAIEVEERARQLLEYYKREAIRSLSALDSAPLKSLLRRVIGRVVDRLE